jgi:hypothetical protein
MRCIYGKGIEGRVGEKAVSIVTSSMDLFNLLMADDICYTTLQQVDEMSNIAHDMGELTAFYSGFDKKWDLIGTGEHISKPQFEADLTDFYLGNYLSGGETFMMNWPNTIELLEKAFQEFDFFAYYIDWFITSFIEAIGESIDELEGEIRWVGRGVARAFRPLVNGTKNFGNWLFEPVDYDDWDWEEYDEDWFYDET